MNATTRRGLFGLAAGATAVAVAKVLPKPAPDVWVGLDVSKAGMQGFVFRPAHYPPLTERQIKIWHQRFSTTAEWHRHFPERKVELDITFADPLPDLPG